MRRRSVPFAHRLAVALVALALLAPRAHASWPHDPYNGGLPVSAATGFQWHLATLPDGAGGAFLAWDDSRTGTSDIYLQHVDASGQALWTPGGLQVSNAVGAKLLPSLVGDGAGGVIVAWEDKRAANSDIYAQRFNAAGTPLWTAKGTALCALAADQRIPIAIADGSGGVIVAWVDFRSASNWDVYAQRLNASGTALWTANGFPVCTATGSQLSPQLVSDAAGGALFAWVDSRATPNHVYAQRVTGAGAGAWTANGVAINVLGNTQANPQVIGDGAGGMIVVYEEVLSATGHDILCQPVPATGPPAGAVSFGYTVCAAAGDQTAPRVFPDGAGGFFVAWTDARGTDADVYAQRMLAPGFPLWNSAGVAVCTATGDQSAGAVMADGAGGTIVAWQDERISVLAAAVFAQRLNGSGTSQWTGNGLAVCYSNGSKSGIGLAPDGGGGAVVAWADARSGAEDIYAQRVDHTGQPGNPEPAITSVRDVPADQGGAVKVSWNASWLDVDPTFLVFDYRVWRSVPLASAANRALAARRGMTTSADEAARTGMLLRRASSAADHAWEFVASTPAAQLPKYSMVVPTAQDSVGGFNKYTAFMVEARSSSSAAADRWFSAPDSGYSVDNLAPVTPAPLTGAYRAGATHLSWNPNHEADLAGYQLYRGTSPAFVPSPATLIASPPDTGWVDAASATFTYKLTAIDVHGNESAPATLSPGSVTAVDGETVRAFFAPPAPNPARSGSVLRFALAAPGRARLELLDAAGRRVRTLAAGAFAAGEQAVRWDGRDEAGRAVAPGLYFARLEAPGWTETRRLAVVE